MLSRRLILALLLLAGAGSAAHAEMTEITIARQPSLGHLPLMIMQDRGILEKNAAARGIPNLKVHYKTLAGGAAITPANARFFASPAPVVLHIVSVSLYALLGAFQFVPSLRRRRHGWHRTAGWIVLPSGLIVALSGLWMTLFYRMPAHDGALVYGLRLLFGSAMLLALLRGIAALWRRDFAQHGNWMLRGYAIGMGAGTQVLTGLAAALIVDPPSKLSRALLMGAAWVINLAVAEWIIRRRPTAPARTAPAVVSQLH